MSPHSYFYICQFLPCKLFLTVLLLLMLSLMLHVTIWHAVHNQVIPSIYTFCTTDQANCLHHASNLTNLQSCIKGSLQTQGLGSCWNCLVSYQLFQHFTCIRKPKKLVIAIPENKPSHLWCSLQQVCDSSISHLFKKYSISHAHLQQWDCQEAEMQPFH